MAEFRVENTEEPVTRAGVQGELSAIVNSLEVKVILTWSPAFGVTEFWVIEESGRLDVSWSLSPQLAVVAAQAVVEVHAGDESARVFEWSPPVEWGLRHVIGRDSLVQPMTSADEATARAEYERLGGAYDLFARFPASSWTLVEGARDE